MVLLQQSYISVSKSARGSLNRSGRGGGSTGAALIMSACFLSARIGLRPCTSDPQTEREEEPTHAAFAACCAARPARSLAFPSHQLGKNPFLPPSTGRLPATTSSSTSRALSSRTVTPAGCCGVGCCWSGPVAPMPLPLGAGENAIRKTGSGSNPSSSSERSLVAQWSRIVWRINARREWAEARQTAGSQPCGLPLTLRDQKSRDLTRQLHSSLIPSEKV